MKSEDLMSVEEMKEAATIASMESEKGDPSKQLHEEEEESDNYGSSHMWFATDDVSGASLDP